MFKFIKEKENKQWDNLNIRLDLLHQQYYKVKYSTQLSEEKRKSHLKKLQLWIDICNNVLLDNYAA